jgi:hypothetical protein
MKKVKIGSVYKTTGLREDIALQFIGHNNVIGDIARVCRLVNASDACKEVETLFIIGFPFSHAIKGGYLRYVADCQVPTNLIEIRFRFPNTMKGCVTSWTILSNEGQKIVRSLDQDQLKYPLAYAVNVEKLEELVNKNWDGKEELS